MRIVVLTTSYPEYEGHPSGHFVETEARLLATEGHTVFVIAPTAAAGQGAHVSVEQQHALTVHRLPHGGALGWPGALARIQQNKTRALGLARYVIAARKQAALLNPDRIIAHWAVPGFFMVPNRNATLRLVSHGEDIRTLLRLPARLRETLVERMCLRAEQWQFVSETLRDSLLIQLSPKNRASVRAIETIAPAALQIPKPKPKPKASATASNIPSPMSDHRKRYVSVGRLIPSKRVERALTYIASLPDQSSELIVVGDGPERAALEGLAQELRLQVNFVGLQPRAEALAWLASATELLLTSEAEGLSTVEREAKALGITTRKV
jgi:glycosyltransferase involved in cell wall biosynthesis